MVSRQIIVADGIEAVADYPGPTILAEIAKVTLGAEDDGYLVMILQIGPDTRQIDSGAQVAIVA